MDNIKTDLLQTIKDQVSQEFIGVPWSIWVDENRANLLWPEVCKRYAFEVAKASLKHASIKAKLKTTFKDQVIQSDFARLQSGAHVSVDKESITDEANIKLIQ